MRFVLAAALPFLVAAAPPPGVPQKKLTIERIFASPPISGATPRLLKLSPDGRYATLLKPRAEDRERFEELARRLDVKQPPNGVATSVDAAAAIAERVGYPVLLRPSYVLGGRGMVIVYDEPGLRDYFERAVLVSEERPVLIDRFREDAFEADVDALCDGETVVIGGVMQHIEEAGVHSGDSACVLPPFLLGEAQIEQMREQIQNIE